MGWPQIVSIVWAGAMLGFGIANHDKPFPGGKWSVWLVALRVALYGCLLWAGGFYTVAQAQVPQPALQYRPLLTRTAHAVWGLDAPVAVFAAQVHQESVWRLGAVSHVGAQGLAQFMPATTRWIAGLHPDLAAQQPFNPAWALRALVTYDLWLYERTPARYDPFDRMWVALRAYNGGAYDSFHGGVDWVCACPHGCRWMPLVAPPAARPCIAPRTWATRTAFWWYCSRAMRRGGLGCDVQYSLHRHSRRHCCGHCRRQCLAVAPGQQGGRPRRCPCASRMGCARKRPQRRHGARQRHQVS